MHPDSTTKQCCKCGVLKPLSEFGKDSRVKSGIRARCKICENGTFRAYYTAHHEAEINRVRNYYRANREKRIASVHVWVMRNRERVRLRDRQRIRSAQYRAYMRSYTPQWIARNRERYEKALRRRRMRKQGMIAIGSHTNQEWGVLKAYYDYRCLCCGKQEPEIKLTRDHVVPVSKGGGDDISNIQPLCIFCNKSKHAKTIDYR